MAKIMLVEDDNSLREIYGERLKAEGFDIVSAGDGEEALAVAVREKPDLIISDVMMPKISGFEMLDILRSTPEIKNTKVIMMTALGQAEEKQRADKLGADRYLVKSQVTLEDMAKVVHEMLGDTPAAAAPATSTAQAPASEPAATPVVVADVPEPAQSTTQDAPATEPSKTSEPTTPHIPTPISSSQSAPVADPVAPAAAVDNDAPDADAAETTAVQTAQWTDKEEADLQAKIEGFIGKEETKNPELDNKESKPADVAASPTAGGETKSKPDQDKSTATEAKSTSTAKTGTIAGMKVIQPLNNTDQKKSIYDLLQKEVSQHHSGASSNPTSTGPAITGNSTPANGADPNSIAL